MKQFKPMLAINTDDLNSIRFPKYASYKLDGIRVIFHPQLGIVSRSLKQIQNKQIRDRFQHIQDEAKRLNRAFDGEFYSHGLTFQEITRAIMTKDFADPKTLKKINYSWEQAVELIQKIEFYCFETISDFNESFNFKIPIIKRMSNFNDVVAVEQKIVNSPQEVKELFAKALDDGYEGLILKDIESPYKFGRSTLKEEYMLKVKPYETFDAEIIGVQQSTIVNPEADKSINELGRSVTSKKKDDRILIEKASAFFVKYGEHELKVSLAMIDEEKEEVWKNKEDYIGKWISYKGMLVGSLNVPRHPVFERFREDKE